MTNIMLKDHSDPYYTAITCSEEGYPIRPAASSTNPSDAAEASSDTILNHERWSGEFKGCAVELPTGTTSGTLAVTGPAAVADGYSLYRYVMVMAPEWLVQKGVGAWLLQIARVWRREVADLQDLAA